MKELKSPNRNDLRPVFPNQLVTVADLEEFKNELLLGVKSLLEENKKTAKQEWLKSYQVRKLLGISNGTLQTLKNNGTLPFSKIGGIIYYNLNDVNKMLEERRRQLSGRGV